MRILIRVLLELLAEQLLYYPCILASAVNMFLHFSVGAILLFLCSLLAALSIHIAILFRYDKKINNELLTFFGKYSNYRFTHADLKEIINRYASYEEIQADLYQNNLTEIGETLTAAVSDYSGDRFSGFKAFPRFFSPNVVILLEGAENYNIFQQFQLFHELGHLGKAHKKVNTFAAHTAAGILGTLLLCVSVYPWYIIIALILPIRLWYFSCLGLSLIFGQEGGECEKLADSFAIKVLLHHPDFGRMERVLMRMNANTAERWQESIDYYKSWFQDPVNMQRGRDFLSRHARSDKMKFLVHKGLTDEAINYNSMIEAQCFPGKYLVAYILCGLQAAGTVLRPIAGWRFWTLLVLPLLVSLVLLIINFKKACVLNKVVNIIFENPKAYQLAAQYVKDGETLFQTIKVGAGKILKADKTNRAFISSSRKT